MSMVTKAAGIDPLISAIRSKNWPVVIAEVIGLVSKFSDKSGKTEAVNDFKKSLSDWKWEA